MDIKIKHIGKCWAWKTTYKKITYGDMFFEVEGKEPFTEERVRKIAEKKMEEVRETVDTYEREKKL